MARVFRGVFRDAGGAIRTVVIKRLRDELATNEDAVRRFANEGEVHAHVLHPNVVSVHGVGADSAGPFIALEWIDGASLKALADRAKARGRRIELRAAVRVLLDALHGLGAAHSARDADGRPLEILHRDATPHNILVGYDGHARLTDFGVAKSRFGPDLTGPGMIVGKFDYLSPEYLCRGQVDARMDVYAMAVTAWVTLAGRRPFSQEAALSGDRLRRRLPNLDSTGVPASVAEVIARAGDPDPDRRFASAGAMADALQQAAEASDALGTHHEVAVTVRALLARSPSRRPAPLTEPRPGDVLGVDEAAWRAEAPTLREL